MNPLKLLLAALLLLCLLDMPYGYYQFVRFAAMASFAFLAYQSYEGENNNLAFLYGALALLFQPFFKVALGRELWNVVDVMVAIFLIINFIRERKNEN